MVEFLLWTALYLLVGFAFASWVVPDTKKKAKKQGTYRSTDEAWAVMPFWITVLWPLFVGMEIYGVIRYIVIPTIRAELSWKYRQKTLGYARIVSHNEPIFGKNVNDAPNWHEVALSKCEYGCKIYEHEKTKMRVLAHNSAYGCKK